ncbi:MAG: glucose-6-phosphate isomerase [Deltaproteobacteria bacterium]|nr:glucose-6-phosphate isomerase [Deltaproteobacteria bacterium]
MSANSDERKAFYASLGEYQSAVDGALAHIKDEEVMQRIRSHDHTVWKDDPAEISNRLGWLHSPEVMIDAVPDINAFAGEIRASGMTHALLMGMGGSSLAPEVFRFTFGVREGFLDLMVLDSTDPGAVRDYAARCDPEKTLFIVSTKSGGTVETMSFMKYFYNSVADRLGKNQAGRRFVAITDPGSGLEETAKTLHFRKIFLNDPDIGGRYSALSYFGLVPAALVGVDIDRLLRRAMAMASQTEDSPGPFEGDDSAARLGAVMGQLALIGRDKLTLVMTSSLGPFGAWVEQLLAESTGKEGKGILPVDGEVPAEPDVYAGDRIFVYMQLEGEKEHADRIRAIEDSGQPVVHIPLGDLYDLGGEFFRWELATAVAGRLLEINPFDQPNVESAKVLARQMVDAYQKEGELPELRPISEIDDIWIYGDESVKGPDVLNDFLSQAHPGENEASGRSYVSIQAYVRPSAGAWNALQAFRSGIRIKCRLATTLGYGPRFLHSTGQLHKGDAGHGLFIQITADMPEDANIPDRAGEEDSSISFGVLKTAQALGDRQALMDAGRKVIRFHTGEDIVEGLKKLSEWLD